MITKLTQAYQIVAILGSFVASSRSQLLRDWLI